MQQTPKPVPSDKMAKAKKESKFDVNFILKEIIEFKGWEIIFQALLYGFVIYGIYALYLVYNFHHDPYFASVKKFSIYDFKLAIIPTIIFFGYKHLCLKFFTPWLKTKMDPIKYPTEKDQAERAKKGAAWLSNVLYYSFTSIMAYILFNDTFFFPTYLGGSAQCTDIYKYTPEVPYFPYGVLFYQVQFGWHFHTLLDHVVYKWKEPKFWEMFLHHCVAVFLIFFSYLCNQVPVGILVLVTHDPSDIGLCGSRLYNDIKGRSEALLVFIYVAFVGSWMYFRLFVFPKCVVGVALVSLWEYPKDSMFHIYIYMCLMMCALVVLHIYWFTYIMRILVGIISRKKEYNIYDKKTTKAN